MRTDLANKGVQFGLEWNHYVQGVADGGRDRTTAYGGTVDYTLNIDLMRMGVLPGALIRFRAESRYGSSVNGAAGPILPVNTDALFPLTAKLDQDVGITITDLNYTQFLSKHLGLFFGKVDTLDADPNEFASGRGTSQFMNANFIGEIGSDRSRFEDPSALQCLAGTAPVSYQSGQIHKVYLRRHCNKLLRHAVHFWANLSRTAIIV